ncbi:Fe2+-dependent dioxygenase [Pseudomonas sp. D8002]|uniref:Fe2+-dependent dioxygenase n=1 Tax=Pseudomonas TaxID=286 RepID=UPI000281C6BA|nr:MULTISPECIES: Fe2+-dependent dioxygenase [Pseudomonas]MBT1267322.1 Fe2+-dependent dioxygenase [Pseudomonas sp. VS38]NVZ30651.1 Fe2+-dependent dioxygenase [Pseudomonas sp. A4002]NVZ40753.1 Fe2+-dependent dioxygenase [Pseudomonas sp. 21615526]NWA90233.1 Fe2+-dependent dioxygenase [Pseudomonas sp. D8002]NWB68355.1 Fe2+-dependent dioxygenase [Pseudomonas sp. I8001]NWB83022.1 Fe2+-dependent dioxygenase [Pseudomonas sp. F9001]
MLIEIPGLLSAEEVAVAVATLLDQPWVDGKVTAGQRSAMAKNNRQLSEDAPVAIRLGEQILSRLSDNALFMSAALPKKIYPPLFNRYSGGEAFDWHIDNAIRGLKGVRERVRTDISATLFLADPASYDGGELVIRDTFGEHAVKLPAGHLLIYPGSSLHKINPVTRGERIASFFWVESLVREDSQRQLLLDMDVAIQRLTAQHADDHALLQLSGAYHNLLRRWSDV